MALDYVDASINRFAVWTVGFRNVRGQSCREFGTSPMENGLLL